MNYKKIIGGFLFLCGAGLMGVFFYIQPLLDDARGKIAGAQKTVDESKFLLGIHPISKRITKNATEKAQGQIDEAHQKVLDYEELSFYSLYGGIGLVIIGGVLLIKSRKKK